MQRRGAPGLEDARVRANGIEDDGAAELWAALRPCGTLRCLDLSGNRVGEMLAELEETLIPSTVFVSWRMGECKDEVKKQLQPALEALGITINPAFLRLLRIFRIMRLLRLMKVSKQLNRLIMTIFKSMPALLNVGVLLFLFMYIYNILGIELFHNLPIDGEFINSDANFVSFYPAMMTLLRWQRRTALMRHLSRCLMSSMVCL